MRVKVDNNDKLIFKLGATKEAVITDYYRIFHRLVQTCKEKSIKINKKTIKLCRDEVSFIGQFVLDKGLKSNPEKIKAVVDMPYPQDEASIRRLTGFTKNLSKFLPRLSELCKLLRELTKRDVERLWFETHLQAIERVKQLVQF